VRKQFLCGITSQSAEQSSITSVLSLWLGISFVPSFGLLEGKSRRGFREVAEFLRERNDWATFGRTNARDRPVKSLQKVGERLNSVKHWAESEISDAEYVKEDLSKSYSPEFFIPSPIHRTCEDVKSKNLILSNHRNHMTIWKLMGYIVINHQFPIY
jgi:hypothetical protein